MPTGDMPPEIDAELRQYIADEESAGGSPGPILKIPPFVFQGIEVNLIDTGTRKYSCSTAIFVRAWLRLVANHPEFEL